MQNKKTSIKEKNIVKRGHIYYLIIILALIIASSLGIIGYVQYSNRASEDVSKVTSLREAIALNNLNATKFLVKNGADIEKRFTVDQVIISNGPDKGFTALGWALYTNRPGIAQYLIENGANVKASVPSESSLLFWAITHEMNDISLLLIDKGANLMIGANTADYYNPALHAQILGMTQVVEKLQKKGVEVSSDNLAQLD